MARKNIPVFIVGESGSGKSLSILKILDEKTKEYKTEGLPVNEVMIMNIEDKENPSDTASEAASFEVYNYKTFMQIMQIIIALGKETNQQKMMQLIETFYKLTGVDIRGKKYLVIDSISALSDLIQTYCKAVFNGYNRWAEYNEALKQTIMMIKRLPLQTFVFALTEKRPNEEDGKTYALVKGKELKYGWLESQFTIVLFTDPQYDANGEVEDVHFRFKPNKFSTAKAPPGMFEAPLKNDLGKVVKDLRAYYEPISKQ